jgi:hypothetical protein
MKKGIFFMLSSFVFLFASDLCVAAEGEPHPEITLIDYECCEPFDLSHNVVSGKYALGAGRCKDCHTMPSPFFNRKVLLDPFNRDGRPVYKEQWQILGYSRKKMKELTKERVIPTESLKK